MYGFETVVKFVLTCLYTSILCKLMRAFLQKSNQVRMLDISQDKWINGQFTLMSFIAFQTVCSLH